MTGVVRSPVTGLIALAVLAALAGSASACDDDRGGADRAGAGTATPGASATASTGASSSAVAPSTTSSSPGAPALCTALEERLDDFASTPMTLGATSEGDESGRYATECDATSEDGTLIVIVEVRRHAGFLDAEAEAAPHDGLRRSSVTAGSRPAVAFTGSLGGQRRAVVVTVVGDRSLVVTVGSSRGLDQPAASAETVRTVALAVTTQVASSLT